MRVTVLHRGEAIGIADLTIDPPFALGTLEPFPSYDALRPLFRDQSRAMRNVGFLPPGDEEVGGVDAVGSAAGQAAFAGAAAVCRELELRDAEGAVVPMKSIGISDWYERSEISLHAFLPDAGGGVPARIPRAPSSESNASSPPP